MAYRDVGVDFVNEYCGKLLDAPSVSPQGDQRWGHAHVLTVAHVRAGTYSRDTRLDALHRVHIRLPLCFVGHLLHTVLKALIGGCPT